MSLIVDSYGISYRPKVRSKRLNFEIKVDPRIQIHIVNADSSKRKSFILSMINLLSQSSDKILYLADQQINFNYLQSIRVHNEVFLVLDDCQIISNSLKLKELLYKYEIQVLIVGRDLQMIGAENLEVLIDDNCLLIQKILTYEDYKSRIKYCTPNLFKMENLLVITEDSTGGLSALINEFHKCNYNVDIIPNKFFKNNKSLGDRYGIKITSASSIRNVIKLIKENKDKVIVLAFDFIQDNAEVLTILAKLIEEDVYILNDFSFEEMFIAHSYYCDDLSTVNELKIKDNKQINIKCLSDFYKQSYLQSDSFEKYCTSLVKKRGIDKNDTQCHCPKTSIQKDLINRIKSDNYSVVDKTHFF